jgi:hypothetical protein
VFAYLVRRWSTGFWSGPGWADLGFLAVAIVFYLGSRDALAKYYLRTGELLRRKDGEVVRA